MQRPHSKCCPLKAELILQASLDLTAGHFLGFFARTGASRRFISCINAANQRNKPALFIASCRAGPGGMLRAISMARSAFVSQSVFGFVFPVKRRPHAVTRRAFDLRKFACTRQRLTNGSGSLPELVGQFADAVDRDGDLVDLVFH